MLFTVKC